MPKSFAERCLAISEQKSALCIGLDPSPEILAKWSLPHDVVGLREFSHWVVEAAAKSVGFIKPQIGFYEAFGSEGYEVLEETITSAREQGLFVIADAKRGDIGSTMRGYASAWFSQDSKLYSDALTVSGYLGVTSLYETAALAAESQAGLFLLAATSNTEASEIQSAHLSEHSIPEVVADLALRCPTNNIGLVIGATRSLSDSNLRSVYDREFEGAILSPGFGAQGAKLGDIANIFGKSARRVIASVSRSVLAEGKAGLSQAIQNSKNEL